MTLRKKIIKGLKHPLTQWLGSLPCALTLIGLCATAVAIATFIESKSQSHEQAAQLVYQNPLFRFLLWGFFINIFLASLHRLDLNKPLFKQLKKNKGFFLTHLGLLMILAGQLVKSHFGLQGQLLITEGCISDQVLLPGTEELEISFKNDKTQHLKLPLSSQHSKSSKLFLKDYQIEARRLFANSESQMQLWVHDKRLSFLPTYSLNEKAIDLDKNPRVELPEQPYVIPGDSLERTWKLSAAYVEEVPDFIRSALEDKLNLKIESDKALLFEGPLKRALIEFSEAPLTISWDLHSEKPCLIFDYQKPEQNYRWKVELSGKDALIAQMQEPSLAMSAPLKIAFQSERSLLVLEDPDLKQYLIALSPGGYVDYHVFDPSHITSLNVYDHGHGGYWQETEIVNEPLLNHRKNLEDCFLYQERALLNQDGVPASAKQLFKNEDEFSQARLWLKFVAYWRNSDHFWMQKAPEDPEIRAALEAFKFEALPLASQNACLQTRWMYKELEKHLGDPKKLLEQLRAQGWPLVSEIELKASQLQASGQFSSSAILELIIEQLVAVAPLLPKQEHYLPKNLDEKTELFCILASTEKCHPASLGRLPSELAPQAKQAFLKAAAFSLRLRQVFNIYYAQNYEKELLESKQAKRKKIASPAPPKHSDQPLCSSELHLQDLEALKRSDTHWQMLKMLLRHYYSELKNVDEPSHLYLSLAERLPTHLSQLGFSELTHIEENLFDHSLVLNCPLKNQVRPLPLHPKLENNVAAIEVTIKKRKSHEPAEQLILSYDRLAKGLRFPADNGKMLLRYQPESYKLPYRLRLRQAKANRYLSSSAINEPPSVFSYDCDLWIEANSSKQQRLGQPVHLSMNQVHETLRGYRFYLSSIFPPEPTRAKKAQIIVSQDPTKYLLTYPGGFILASGIFLLFSPINRRPRD